MKKEEIYVSVQTLQSIIERYKIMKQWPYSPQGKKSLAKNFICDSINM